MYKKYILSKKINGTFYDFFKILHFGKNSKFKYHRHVVCQNQLKIEEKDTKLSLLGQIVFDLQLFTDSKLWSNLCDFCFFKSEYIKN